MGLLGKLFARTPKKAPLRVTDANFSSEILQSPMPVVLDVWGSSCSHCRLLEPVLMELAGVYDGRVRVAEMNAELAPRAVARLQIRGTPTVLFLRGGKELDRVVGFRSSLYHHQAIEELFQITRE